MTFNPLLSAPTTSVETGGTVYQIDTDYRAAIKAWETIELYDSGELERKCGGDRLLANATFNHMLIEHLYLEPKPDIYSEQALRLINDYLGAFNRSAPDRKPSKMPPYGYLAIEQDSDMLYGAFLRIGINLRKTPLTLEDFLAHLPNLPEDCEYCRVMSLRSQWYDNRPKKEALKDLKRQIESIGWSKVLIKTNETEKKKEAFDKYLAEIEQLRTNIRNCKASNQEWEGGVCSKEICAVRGRRERKNCKQ